MFARLLTGEIVRIRRKNIEGDSKCWIGTAYYAIHDDGSEEETFPHQFEVLAHIGPDKEEASHAG